MTDLITGTFNDGQSADRAATRLQQLGYTQDDISVIMSDETRQRHFPNELDEDVDDDANVTHGRRVGEGAGVGAGVGGVIGAVVAGLMATGSIVAIAGTGGVATPIVAGPLAAALAGLGAGGLSGGIVGGLIGAGIPKHHAERYAADVESGRIVVGVQPRGGNDQQVVNVLQAEGAHDVRAEHAGIV